MTEGDTPVAQIHECFLDGSTDQDTGLFYLLIQGIADLPGCWHLAHTHELNHI